MGKIHICVFLLMKFKKINIFKGISITNFRYLINSHWSGKQVDMAICLSSFCQEKLEPPNGTHSIPFKGKNRRSSVTPGPYSTAR